MAYPDPSKTIDALGGTVAVARICDVSSQAVSKWRRDGIPKARLMYLQAVRPDVCQSRNASISKQEAA